MFVIIVISPICDSVCVLTFISIFKFLVFLCVWLDQILVLFNLSFKSSYIPLKVRLVIYSKIQGIMMLYTAYTACS